MKKALIYSFLFFPLISLGNVVRIPFSQTLDKGGKEIGIETSYFKTLERINYQGKKYLLEDGESYSITDFKAFLLYGLTSRFELGIDANIRKIDSSFYYKSELIETSITGPESAGVTLKYSWPYEAGFQWALEATYRNSFYTNNELKKDNLNDIVLGEDGQEVSLGFSLTYLTKGNNYISSRFLYRNPDEDLSSEVLIDIEGVYNFSSISLFVGGEANISLKNDPYSGVASPNINTGGTELFNSTNREWKAAKLGGELKFNNDYRLALTFKRYLEGQSTDLGDQLLFSITKRAQEDNYFKKYDSEFKEYRVEAAIEKIAQGEKGIIIDKGLESGVYKGMKFDIYKFNYIGGNVLIASGYVTKVSADRAIVLITSRYHKTPIEESMVVRGGLIKE